MRAGVAPPSTSRHRLESGRVSAPIAAAVSPRAIACIPGISPAGKVGSFPVLASCIACRRRAVSPLSDQYTDPTDTRCEDLGSASQRSKMRDVLSGGAARRNDASKSGSHWLVSASASDCATCPRMRSAPAYAVRASRESAAGARPTRDASKSVRDIATCVSAESISGPSMPYAACSTSAPAVATTESPASAEARAVSMSCCTRRTLRPWTSLGSRAR